MVNEKLLSGVKEIKNSIGKKFIVANAVEKALEIGTDEALTKALMIARESGSKFHVVNTANKALGFDKIDF